MPYARYIAAKAALRLKLRRVPLLPVVLDIEPENNCNFKCGHCQVTHWSKPTVHLKPKEFEHIVDQFPAALNVKLQGMGEPLLNTATIPMLRAGEARGVPMSFTTNGSVMTPAIANGLLSLRGTHITFSIDGATAEVFEKIRVGGKFDKVCENISKLVAQRGAATEPPIEVWTVVTKDNLAQLPDIVRLAKRLGVDAVTMQLFMSNWGKSEMESRIENTRVSMHDHDLQATLHEAQRVAREVDIPMSIHRADFMSKKKPCHWPWVGTFIASNGDVVPCPIVGDASVIKMGNVLETSFRDIWNNAAYQQLRDQIATNELPHFCRGCYQ